MRIPRRTKKKYAELYDDPTALFGGTCEVVLFPNGQPEIWIRSSDGRRQMVLTASDGPAGLGLNIRRSISTPAMTLSGNEHQTYNVFPAKGADAVDLADVSVCQYRTDDERAAAFKEWYGGRTDSPPTFD